MLMIFNWLTCLIDGIRRDITTLIRPWSNSNEGVTLHFPELQNWSLSTKFSIMPRIPHIWGGGGDLSICRGYRQRIVSPADWIKTRVDKHRYEDRIIDFNINR